MPGAKADTLRRLIQADEILVAPGAFDGLSGALVAQAGFNSVYLGGWATGASTTITEPMANITDMIQRAREIIKSTRLPLIMDGNAGFGNPTHTYQAVRNCMNAGVAGIHIEDQVYPKRFHYHAGREYVVSVPEMVTKLNHAARAKNEREGDIVIIGRTDFLGSPDADEMDRPVEEAVDRLNRYLDAGAEVGMLVSVDSKEQFEYAINHVDGPMLYVNGDHFPYTPTPTELESLGCAVTIYSTAVPVAAAGIIHELLENIRENGVTGWEGDEVRNIRENIVMPAIDMPKYWELESDAGLK